MKKMLLSAILLIGVAAFASQNPQLVSKSLQFVAPGVSDRFAVLAPQEGEIIYEATIDGNKSLLGRVDGTWVPLSAGVSVFPSGVILPYVGSTPPAGFVICNGQELNKVGPASGLFAVVGNTYGTPSNPDKFKVPDLRGQFLRGLDGSGNVDKQLGRTLGSTQPEALKAHDHGFSFGVTSGYASNYQTQPGPSNWTTSSGYNYRTEPVGGQETRPVNMAVNYIIKL